MLWIIFVILFSQHMGTGIAAALTSDQSHSGTETLVAVSV